MLDVATINDCLTFLSRTELRGNEVPAFTNVVSRLQYLREELQNPTTPEPGDVPAQEIPRRDRRRKATPAK
jgi:hypothetical protein